MENKFNYKEYADDIRVRLMKYAVHKADLTDDQFIGLTKYVFSEEFPALFEGVQQRFSETSDMVEAAERFYEGVLRKFYSPEEKYHKIQNV